MADELRFDGRVAVVTGAGNGLGRSHALLLGARGAKVVVNDLGGAHTGGGRSSAAADAVVAEIRAAGGEAVASYDSVEDGDKIVQAALDSFGRVDLIINNAGILRDVSYAKMTAEDWDLVYRVHVLGAHRVTAAAWPHLRNQKYGRVVLTASAAGIYGNFGQANYAMAKLGLVGFGSTLALEGKKANVLVNTIAPIAGSRMTETVLPPDLLAALKPEYVSPLVAWLCHESNTDTGGLYEVGGGFVGKLRWERTEGVTWRQGRAFGPEEVRDRWGEVSDFSKTTHPASVTESMGPIMANVEAGPSKGGNKFIDVDQALGYAFPPQESAYTERDTALYALGVGAAHNALDPADLSLVYEMNPGGFYALPTMIAAITVQQVIKLAMEGHTAPGMNYGLDRILHGEQYTELLRPLPAAAKLTHKGFIKAIYDKGKGAVVVTEVKSYEEDGSLLAINELSTFVRGAGGWGGDRGPSVETAYPDRAPDAVVEEQTRDDQALLYRLSGDVNPLHADPDFAGNFGFPRPILHGLCTYGFAARHVVRAFLGGDPRRVKSVRARFADPVVPGETLVTEMWKEGEGRVVFRTRVKERDKVVLANGAAELYAEVPVKAAKKPAAKAAEAPKAPEAAKPAEGPTSAEVFGAIGHYLSKNPEVGARIGVVYLFKLNAPDSAYTLDLKRNVVEPGETAKAECTLSLSDSDFRAMVRGEANPMKLFTSGKLKISGNVMASQKLDFLQKIDKDALAASVASAAPSAAPAAAAPAAAPAAAHEPIAPKLFAALAKRPELAAGLEARVQFHIAGVDRTWVVDAAASPPTVTPGTSPDVAASVLISDDDLAALAAGKDTARSLFLHGKMRVEGDARVAQRLGFFASLHG